MIYSYGEEINYLLILSLLNSLHLIGIHSNSIRLMLRENGLVKITIVSIIYYVIYTELINYGLVSIEHSIILIHQLLISLLLIVMDISNVRYNRQTFKHINEYLSMVTLITISLFFMSILI